MHTALLGLSEHIEALLSNRSTLCMLSHVIEGKKARWVEDFLFDTEHSSLQLYRNVYKATHSDYSYSDYLSKVKCYPHRRLISRPEPRFRYGCHGLHVDTGCFGKGMEQLNREKRVCHACLSDCVEDEHHFLFDCSASDSCMKLALMASRMTCTSPCR